ncbi:cyclin-T-like isoform X2 [Polistes fuscatus]|uniref:cyclin-T-like isoform X2 n=1 Tax=Polistes fuscatus TaxID=30207 RepID=UPI001CA8C9F8|nr:cyclin-T-like isoform X2 [Polistes fuscatus]
MAADEKWYFTKEQLINTPSRRCGIDADKELSYRQQAANFIQDMGQRLVVTQLCINTAIVYMHRFYVFHSLSQFHRNSIAAAALFLAAKVEEQPRKLEHVIKMAYMCLHREQPPDRSEQYLEQAQDLVFNENVLLQTLGFDVAIDHPHTHVVRCCQLVKASKDLAQTSYFMASNSLHLTTMCLQYKPTVVACFCIHLACKWSNWEIPQSNEGRHWFWYVDKTVTSDLLQQLTAEFLHIFDKCPSRLKKKIMSISANQSPSINHQNVSNNSLFDAEPRKVPSPATAAEGGPTFHSNRPHHSERQEERRQLPSTSARPPVDYREYKEKKERERLEREKAPTPSTSSQSHAVDINKHHSSHHHKPVPGTSMPNKHSVPPGQKSTLHHNHHHRQEIKVNQPIQQRHSTGNQPRESNRDPSRQRIAREYNSSSSSNTNSSVHSHGGHILHQTKDANTDNALPDNTSHRSDVATLQDNLSNNNHNLQRLSTMDGKHQPHDKRVYDPRHKPVDHKKDGEQKAYNKYPDSSRDRQRKSDSLEQRSEEVRKLIEKPLPYPKTALDVQHAANIQKSSYHGKYSQPDKLQGSTSAFVSDMKSTAMPQNTFTQEKSPTTLVSSLSQIPQKSISSKSIISQHSAYGVSQTLKDSIKNGNSQSSCLTPLNNIDDPKAEKRPRHEESIDQQQNLLPTPVTKHKSLFSPEKVQISRESHSQRPKSKQKTPPSAVKVPKQDRAPETLTGLNLATSFTSPPNLHQTDMMTMKRSGSDLSGTSHKRHRTISSSENESQVKGKIEDIPSLEVMKMHSRVPEIIQPIRDNPSSNGRSISVSSELQPPESIKPFESESRFSTIATMATNGLDAGIETQQVQMEYLSPMKSAQSISALLQEPLAPLPSLLQGMQQFSQITSQQAHQEQVVQQEQQQQSQQSSQQQSQMQLQMQAQTIQHQHQQSHQQQQPITSHSLLLPNSQLAVQTQCMTLPSSMTETSVVSTVDISVLSAPVQTNTDGIVQTVPTTTLQPVVAAVIEEKRTEHHKSEKKKKKEKHKHKDKEKSKEKHKHKHKDKDKEKHREKDKEKNEETLAAAPIKITIPKEKLNLSGETAVTSGGTVVIPEKNKSPQGTGLKLKILKDRLKSAESIPGTQAQPVPQAPLKMKIRTDAIWRSSTGSAPVTTTSASTIGSVPDYSGENRKRERTDANESASNVFQSAKKQQHYHNYHHHHQHQQQQQQQQPQSQQVSSMVAGGHGQYRSGERQNGRHYSSGSNNKERHTSSHHKSTSKISQNQQTHAT